MEIDGRKIVIITKDDQGKPDLAKTALTEAYEDDGADIAIGTTSSPATIAMLPVAEEHKKILIVEPAVADQITGDKWNRYIFRTARNSSQDAISNAVAIGAPGVQIGVLAQSTTRSAATASPRSRSALAKTGATLGGGGIRARQHHRLHRRRPAPVRRAEGQAGQEADLDRLGRRRPIRWPSSPTWTPAATASASRPAGNILPVLAAYKRFPGLEGAAYYYYGIPKNPINDWLVAEHQKRFNAPPDFFTCGGFAAAMALVASVEKAGVDRRGEADPGDGGPGVRHAQGQDDLPQGGPSGAAVDVRVQDQGRSRTSPGAIPELTRELKIEDMDIPIRNKR